MFCIIKTVLEFKMFFIIKTLNQSSTLWCILSKFYNYIKCLCHLKSLSWLLSKPEVVFSFWLSEKMKLFFF